jgi:hypothetical protein
MPGHLWGLQSRSPRERSHARTVPEEDILVVISVKEEGPGEVLPGAGAAETSATTRVAGIEAGVRAQRAAETSATTRVAGIEAGVRAQRAAETSATTRVAGIEAGVRAQRAAETSATTRVAGIEAEVRATLAGKPVILDGEEIQERVGGATGDVDPTPAFFIRLILRVLWRRVLR